MNPEMAKTLMTMSLENRAREWDTTRKVILAIPEGQEDYKPHEKSMTALELAWHIAFGGIWFLRSLANGAFDPSTDFSRPETVKTAADVVAFYESNVDEPVAQCAALSGETLAEPLDFFGMMSLPRVAYMNFDDKHTIHHRGQLSVYLRPMGAKVPSIYGSSADSAEAEKAAEQSA